MAQFLLLVLFTAVFSTSTFHSASAHEHENAEIAHEATNQEIQVTVQKIGENVHFLQGKGGNIAVLTGQDGAIMIDDDYAEITPTILKAVKSFTDQNIKYLINTHWHGDHTGGNELLGTNGATIMAHDNVRSRLSVDNYVAAFDMKTPAKPEIGLPSVTFNDTLSLHMNGEDIKLVHVGPAHTDGDIIIVLPKNNIIHTGDIYFNGFYPFIDASTGGKLRGMIEACEKILSLSDEQTKIIPGHGALSNKAELQAYHDMLAAVEAKLKPLVEAGKSVEEIAAENPLAEFNDKWGHGFIPADKWLGIVVDSMKESTITNP